MKKTKLTIAILLFAGMAVGVVATTGFQYSITATSTEEFCISCHEMRENPYKESLLKPHKKNHSGVQATCSDCHLPREFIPKMERKIIALREVWHHIGGKLDTPEKYDEHRQQLAERVWRDMEANDSKACRDCHDIGRMDFSLQSQAAATTHPIVQASGMTCISCHKGIAHELP